MKYIEIDKSINGIYYQENKILQTCFHGGGSKELLARTFLHIN